MKPAAFVVYWVGFLFVFVFLPEWTMGEPMMISTRLVFSAAWPILLLLAAGSI